MPQFVISYTDIKDDRITISDDRYRHVKSLRINIGERAIFIDESGNTYIGVLDQLQKHKAVFKILKKTNTDGPGTGIILAQSIIKKDRMLVALQKATELGVDAIIPFTSRYTIVHVKDTNFMSRCNAVIKEAVSQSMRHSIPRLYGPADYKELIKTMPGVYKILFHNGDNSKPFPAFIDRIQKSVKVMLIIGPEGGFSEDEIGYAREHSVSIACLGNNILRAETAAMTAISIASFLRTK
jgi:16S rRNA (uracil1498-N3)-methyltransferase